MKTTPIIIACVVTMATSAALAQAPKESKEKGGTADINIGVGELQKGKGALAAPGANKASIILPGVQSVREARPRQSKSQDKATPALTKKTVGPAAGMLPPAVQSPRETAPRNAKDGVDQAGKRRGNVEQVFKVEEGK